MRDVENDRLLATMPMAGVRPSDARQADHQGHNDQKRLEPTAHARGCTNEVNRGGPLQFALSPRKTQADHEGMV